MPTSEVDDGAEIDHDADAGRRIITLSWAGTAVFTVAALIATVFPEQVARPVAVFDSILFLAGVVAFLLAYARAIGRSREEAVDIVGVYFLGGGSAPAPVRRQLLGSFAVQVVVALATSSIRLYTSVAFGILVPMLGLGLAGLWGATYGRFPERER